MKKTKSIDPMKMTKRRMLALQIVREFEPIRPRWFAEKFWPRDEWRYRPINTGINGSHKGRGMYIAAGAYLSKLEHAGFLRWSPGRPPVDEGRGFRLTHDGRRLLEEAEARQKGSQTA